MNWAQAMHWLIEFSTFDRIVAVLTLIVAAFGTWFAMKGPDKKGQERLEKQAKEQTAHLKLDRHHKDMERRASRVSITVDMAESQNLPYEIHLVLKDPTVKITSIDLCNSLGSAAGSAECTGGGTLYIATVDPQMMKDWFNSGITPSVNREELVIRVNFLIEKVELHRNLPVRMISGTRIEGQIWMLKGSV